MNNQDENLWRTKYVKYHVHDMILLDFPCHMFQLVAVAWMLESLEMLIRRCGAGFSAWVGLQVTLVSISVRRRAKSPSLKWSRGQRSANSAPSPSNNPQKTNELFCVVIISSCAQIKFWLSRKKKDPTHVYMFQRVRMNINQKHQ